MAVASTYNNHTVLVGLGHLGYRVVQKLHEMEENVVVVEVNPNVDTLTAVRKMGIPVIEDDATRPSVLEAAKIAQRKDHCPMHAKRCHESPDRAQSAQHQ